MGFNMFRLKTRAPPKNFSSLFERPRFAFSLQSKREIVLTKSAAILKFGSSGKRHHCGKDAASKFPVHVRIAIFAANQRTGMETVIDKAKNFLRVSVTPVFRPSSLGIIPNLFSGSQLAKYGHCYYEAA